MLENVLAYGAKGTDCCDDTAAINRALATGRPVFFPPGTYQTTGGHVLAHTGQAAYGVTADSTVIRCTNPDATIFTTAAYCTGITYRDLRLTRSVPATGGYG